MPRQEPTETDTIVLWGDETIEGHDRRMQQRNRRMWGSGHSRSPGEEATAPKICPTLLAAQLTALAFPTADNQEAMEHALRAGKMPASCMGSRCMLWRPMGSGLGYCGLASKPNIGCRDSSKELPAHEPKETP